MAHLGVEECCPIRAPALTCASCAKAGPYILYLAAPGRERNDGLYRVITYLCAKMLDELIVAVVVSFILSCILFYGVRFPGDLVVFWLVYLVTLSVGIGAPPPAMSVHGTLTLLLKL